MRKRISFPSIFFYYLLVFADIEGLFVEDRLPDEALPYQDNSGDHESHSEDHVTRFVDHVTSTNDDHDEEERVQLFLLKIRVNDVA